MKSKADMTKELLITIFKKVSLLDLSDCEFEYEPHWCNAIKNGSVIDAIEYDGNIFSMMDNGGDFHPLNPMLPAFEILYKEQFTTPVQPTQDESKEVEREFFLPPDFGEGWELGAETFSRQEVFNLLYTQRAMISNDFKTYFGDVMIEEMYGLLNNPRIPKF